MLVLSISDDPKRRCRINRPIFRDNMNKVFFFMLNGYQDCSFLKQFVNLIIFLFTRSIFPWNYHCLRTKSNFTRIYCSRTRLFDNRGVREARFYYIMKIFKLPYNKIAITAVISTFTISCFIFTLWQYIF